MSAPLLPVLERSITGRQESFFARDMARCSEQLRSAVEGRRVLIIGGGGSIGSAATRALLALRPSAVHVVDLSENYLAELVRDARSGDQDLAAIDLQTHVFDYGAPAMYRFLAGRRRFDVTFNFAAVKHVRSEKDIYSLLHMVDVNVVRQARFKRWLAETGHNGRYFAVSTDKAANPSSLMGATKRVMESVVFDVMPGAFAAVTSARFANVAFSNGSLLQSFFSRMDKRQPLAVPTGTRRYFISHSEAAEICLLTALLAPSEHIVFPVLQPERHLLSLQDVVGRVLTSYGFTAWFTTDEAAAKRAMSEVESLKRWPVLLTPLDTSGEKPFEEFVGDGEYAVPVGFEALQGIAHRRGTPIEAMLDELACYVDDPSRPIDKERLAAILMTMVPTMRHIDTGRSLDTRM